MRLKGAGELGVDGFVAAGFGFADGGEDGFLELHLVGAPAEGGVAFRRDVEELGESALAEEFIEAGAEGGNRNPTQRRS